MKRKKRKKGKKQTDEDTKPRGEPTVIRVERRPPKPELRPIPRWLSGEAARYALSSRSPDPKVIWEFIRKQSPHSKGVEGAKSRAASTRPRLYLVPACPSNSDSAACQPVLEDSREESGVIPVIPICKQDDGTYSVPGLPFTDHQDIETVEEEGPSADDIPF